MPENPDMKFYVMPVVTITDALFVASNVPEDDYAAWAIGATYAINARVIVLSTHSIYQSIAGGNVGHDPVADVDPLTNAGTYWLRVSATNRWKAFDQRVSDDARSTLGFVSYTVTPGASVDTLVMHGLASNAEDGADITVDVNGTQVFYGLLGSKTLVFQGLVLDAISEVKVTVISLSGPGSLISIGQISFGKSTELGDLMTGGVVELVDYSKSERDTFGNLILIQRGYAAKVQYEIAIETLRTLYVFNILANMRARPVVYHGGELSVPYGMVQLATLTDFRISQPNMTVSNVSISVDGLT